MSTTGIEAVGKRQNVQNKVDSQDNPDLDKGTALALMARALKGRYSGQLPD